MQLRRLLILFLMFAVLTANFTQLFVFAGFTVNQRYIATTLCVNRDKPWLHCNGRCYLANKLKQAEQKEKSEERQTQKSLFQEVFFASVSNIKFHNQLLQVIATPYRSNVQSVQPGVIFRPPQV